MFNNIQQQDFDVEKKRQERKNVASEGHCTRLVKSYKLIEQW